MPLVRLPDFLLLWDVLWPGCVGGPKSGNTWVIVELEVVVSYYIYHAIRKAKLCICGFFLFSYRWKNQSINSSKHCNQSNYTRSYSRSKLCPSDHCIQ